MSNGCSRQQKETLLLHTVPQQPWTKVGLDLSEYNHTHYITIVDYTTDYLEYNRLNNQTAETVINSIKRCFGRLGIPRQVHTDNGPQFTSHQFSTFNQSWNFRHTTSSLYHTQSNEKAESAVKIIKRILRKCKKPEFAVLEHLNTTKQDLTASPYQQLIGRPTRSVLPQVKPETEDNQGWWEKQGRNEKLQQRFNDSARDLAALNEGQPVLVRDWSQHRRKWQEAQINKQLSSRAYAVQFNNNLFWKNR